MFSQLVSVSIGSEEDVMDQEKKKMGRPARLSAGEVQLIRELRAQGMTYKQLGEKFDVSESYVYQLCREAQKLPVAEGVGMADMAEPQGFVNEVACPGDSNTDAVTAELLEQDSGQDSGLEEGADTHVYNVNGEQVGGDHYRRMAIQPWDYIAANGLDYFEGNIIKYVTRWRGKNGLEDLRKAQHYLDKLFEVAGGAGD